LKSLMSFLSEVLNELGTWCHTSATRDLKTIESRVEHEGLSFLTITLPNFGKDFERSLDRGYVAHDLFTGFRFSGGLPAFLRGFLEQVFDSVSGRLLDEPDKTSIWAMRQITLMFAKILVDCSDERMQAAFDSYIKCESDVVRSTQLLHGNRLETEFQEMSRLLYREIFVKVDRKIYIGDIRGKHGPGSTADKVRGNAKYFIQEWTSRLEEVFPHQEYLATSYSLALANLSGINIREPEAERPVEVLAVPKTLKTPRIIAREPSYMQFMQQGILEAVVQALSTDNLVSKFISFEDQSANQQLAREGSLSGDLATLDLSEASDRVSNRHVELMLHGFSSFGRAVQATRSLKADVRGHGVIPLTKFASMGSALTFPMEAMVFLTLIFLGIQKELRRPLTRKDLYKFSGMVRVYGDDIIVPVEYVSSVVTILEAFGFKINANKSFWTGKFRESCGKEYYDGEDVSIVRVRRVFPTQRKHVEELESMVSLRNQLYMAGMWRTVKWLDRYLERLIPFPAVLSHSEAMGKTSFLGYEYSKIGGPLQRPLVKAAVPRRRIPVSPLDDYGALLKFLIRRGIEPNPDARHLERAGRPDSVDIKIGWAYSA